MDRRDWLKAAGLLALERVAGVRARASPESTSLPSASSAPRSDYARFRPSGFRVEAETFGNKTVVHNYGHGGGGMSLSWGSSHLAVEKALETGEDRFAIIGCGVMGLSTGRLLQKLGKDVTIYSKDIPPNTTSNMSAAWWSPGSTVDPNERTDAYDEQFVKAARFANRYYQNYVGLEYGVRWRPRYSVSEQPPESTTRSLIADLFPEG